VDEKLTTKSQEALSQAVKAAAAAGNPSVDGLHLLDALIQQESGTAAPLLRAVGADPGDLLARARAELARMRLLENSSRYLVRGLGILALLLVLPHLARFDSSDISGLRGALVIAFQRYLVFVFRVYFLTVFNLTELGLFLFGEGFLRLTHTRQEA